MAYDEGLAARIREVLADREDTVEKKMFGGLCLMVRGHMAVGIVKETLMVRTGKEAHAEALTRAHARPMDFTGRALKGMVYVDPAGFESDEDLAGWIDVGLRHAESLPPK